MARRRWPALSNLVEHCLYVLRRGSWGCLIFLKDSGFLQPSGSVGWLVGAVIVLLVWTRFDGRSSIRS